MDRITNMVTKGYRFGAPTREAELIDSQVASRLKCPHCGSTMYYQGWHRSGSYIALAVCRRCGYELEF